MSGPGQDFQASEIRAQLARILGSRAFARANRSCQLLSYLVQRALEDRVEQLKEYPIAVEVFGRDKSFDPRIDSLVRVEFTRLRNRLAAYYETATEDDAILISLSAGSYLPLFERRIARTAALPSAENPRPASMWRRVYWLALPILVLAALAGFSTLRPVDEARTSRGEQQRTLRRLSLPQEALFFPALSPDGKDIYFASNRGHGAFRIWRQHWDGGEAVPMTPAGSDALDVDVSPDGRWILYWKEGKQGEFDKVFKSGITPGRHEREPIPIAPSFDDAHNPQWTPDMRILLCGTLRTNVPAMEHDLWVVGSESSDCLCRASECRQADDSVMGVCKPAGFGRIHRWRHDVSRRCAGTFHSAGEFDGPVHGAGSGVRVVHLRAGRICIHAVSLIRPWDESTKEISVPR